MKLTAAMAKGGASFSQIVQQAAVGGQARVMIITHQMSKAQLATLAAELAATETIRLNCAYKVIE